MWRKWLCHEKLHMHNGYELTSRSLCASNYIPFVKALIYNTEVYNWWSYIDTVIHISRVISSTFVSDLDGSMKCILCLIFIAPHCKVIVPLVQYYVITSGPLYGFFNYYSALLLSMNLSLTMWSWSSILYFCGYSFLLIFACFFWRINSQSTLCFIGRTTSRPNTNWPIL